MTSLVTPEQLGMTRTASPGELEYGGHPDGDWAYIHISKCASSAVMALPGWKFLDPPEVERQRQRFAIVRNPYARVYSAWSAMTKVNEQYGGDWWIDAPWFTVGMPFPDFLRAAAEQRDIDLNRHVRPQAWFLQEGYDRLLQFEQLTTAWPLFAEQQGLPPLEQVNVQDRQITDFGWHVSHYTPRDRALVAERFSEDFDHWEKSLWI